ncbi:hypothetical protein J3459_010930 [Metarhizium acridum]|nr:hypothetical protein J3459_010930 [Metarhizium acridum]
MPPKPHVVNQDLQEKEMAQPMNKEKCRSMVFANNNAEMVSASIKPTRQDQEVRLLGLHPGRLTPPPNSPSPCPEQKKKKERRKKIKDKTNRPASIIDAACVRVSYKKAP